MAKAAPDGHTLMVAEAGTYVINPNVYPKDKLTYDVEKDLIQITGLVRIHHALVATPSLPVKSLGELVALAKKKPGALTYGTAGVGSGPHLNMVRLENATGVKLAAGPLPGGDARVDRRHRRAHQHDAGQRRLALGAGRAGKVKMLRDRKPATLCLRFPTFRPPTRALPGYVAGTWFGLFDDRRNAARDRDEDQRGCPAGHWPSRRSSEQFVHQQLYEPMTSSPEEFASSSRPRRSGGPGSSASRTCRSATSSLKRSAHARVAPAIASRSRRC